MSSTVNVSVTCSIVLHSTLSRFDQLMPIIAASSGGLHFIRNIPQHFCPALEIVDRGSIEPDCHVASDPVDGVVPPIEVERAGLLFIVGNTDITGNCLLPA